MLLHLLMRKRRSPIEIIESTKKPEVEHAFLKYPGEEPIDFTDYQRSTPSEAKTTNKTTIMEANQNRPFTHIHTHPAQTPEFTDSERRAYKKQGLGERELSRTAETSALPSPADLRTLIVDDDMKTMVIAVRDTKTGEVRGYRVIKKTKEAPKFGVSKREFNEHPIKTILNIINANHFGFGRAHKTLIDDLNSYGKQYSDSLKSGDYNQAVQALDNVTHKYHLRHRMVSARGYHPNEARTTFVKKRGLEQIVVVSIITLLGAILFLFPTFTANVIGNNVNSTPRWIGGALFIIGVVWTFIYFKVK